MWEKITSSLLSLFLSANILGAPTIKKEGSSLPLEITIEPLATTLQETREVPEISAKAALVIETHSNEALFAKNVWEPLPIASLTKLMTALVVKEKLNLFDIITVDEDIKNIPGSKMGLKSGEKITVENLLRGLLMNSGNDAALVLSKATAGSAEAFVKLMNERKISLGLEKTFFADPTGISDENVSSAFEIAHLAKYVFKDAFLQSVMREKEMIVNSVDGVYTHVLSNTNRLLGTDIAERIIAGKTGTTPLAGQCLISFIENDSNRTTLTILLGSENRYEEIKKLIFWIDQHFVWIHS